MKLRKARRILAPKFLKSRKKYEVDSTFLQTVSEGNENGVLTWSEVNSVHRSRNGIYQKNGELISLLTDFGKISRCYPDITTADKETIFYTGAGRRGNQKLDVYNRALIDAIRLGISVPLYCKLGVNKWQYLGKWKVVDSEYIFEEINERMVWRFVLRTENGGLNQSVNDN